MKKKLVLLLLTLCMATTLIGCGLKKEKEAAAPTTEEPEIMLKEDVEKAEADKKGETVDQKEDVKEPIKEAATETASKETVIAEADKLAAGYDYDGAIEKIKTYTGYETDDAMKAAIAGYESTKSTCVAVDVDKIPHIFYHTLIADNSKAFDGDARAAGYNQVMTTISEFNKITQQMYDKGYVLVRLRDMAEQTKDADGTVHFTKGKIMLPPGKKAFVLSIDDVSYYHYMATDGFANKVVLDENGKPKCEIKKSDGTTEVGDFDVMPLMDKFIEEHPDAAYRGARGMIALTGYNGVLGYRTDTAYKTKEHLDKIQKEFLDATPDFNFEKEVEEATKVANGLKAAGWEFASHTWGHLRAGSVTMEHMQEDTTKWLERVAPIIGETDTIIFAFGEDIGDWKDYAADNEKFNYLKGKGFNFFCNVDSSPYWVQIRDNYVRQGRRNLDGYRMYYDLTGETNKTADLFDVKSVFDPDRPTPVPPMGG